MPTYLLTEVNGGCYVVKASDPVYAAEELDLLLGEADITSNQEVADDQSFELLATSRSSVKKVVASAD